MNSKNYPKSQHVFEDVYFKKSVMCSYCSDYIWEERGAGSHCKGCHQFYHISCKQFVMFSCNGNYLVQNDRSLISYEPIDFSSWGEDDVMEWMAVANIHRYAQVFKSHHIMGVDLLSLEENHLRTMKIVDSFHITSIMNAVKMLRTSPSASSSSSARATSTSSLAPPPKITLRASLKTSTPEISHDFSIHSFSSMQACHVCHKFLYGIVHQGFQCQVCGLCCHRKCAKSQLPSCPCTTITKRNSFNADSQFGKSLMSFQDVPQILTICTKEIEDRVRVQGSHLLNVYRHSPSTNDVHSLKITFDTNVNALHKVNLSDHKDATIGGVLKKFLRDLPDTVICESMYQKFLAIGNGDMERRVTLINSLPVIHCKTLKFFLNHLKVDILKQPENCKKLSRIFSQIIMRPPWSEIKKIIQNSEQQTKCLQILLEMPDFTEKELCRAVSRNKYDLEAPWFHGDISRDEINDLLMGTPDGTFIVRHSTTKDENEPYTLTLRKGGANKLIKICQKNGYWYLSASTQFASVYELIEHYTKHSLVHFNNSLDITLQYPLHNTEKLATDVKEDDDIDQLRQEFRELCIDIIELTEKLESQHSMDDKLNEDLKKLHGALSAYKLVQMLYADQLMKAEKFRTTRSSNDKIFKESEKSSCTIKNEIEKLRNSCLELQAEMDRANAQLKVTILDIDKKKDQLSSLNFKRDMLAYKLLSVGESTYNIDLMQKGEEISTDYIPHYDESTWMADRSDRHMAEEYLRCKKKGTFLIRRKTEDSYALSIVAPNPNKDGLTIGHCLIDKTETGYGFAEPFYIHKDLKDLVLHYRETSLIEYNDILDVKLEFPAFAN